MHRSTNSLLILTSFLAGCGGNGGKEPAVKVQTSGAQVVITDSAAPAVTNGAAKPVAEPAPVKKTIGKFTVQIGAFRSKERAIEARSKYKSMGYDAYMEKTTIGGKGQAWYRVRIGRFQRISEAEKVSRELNAKGDIKAWVDKIRG